jgi:hypothetical protein
VIAKQCQSAILPGKRFRFGAVELLLGGTAGSKKEFAQGGQYPPGRCGVFSPGVIFRVEIMNIPRPFHIELNNRLLVSGESEHGGVRRKQEREYPQLQYPATLLRAGINLMRVGPCGP